MRSVGRRWACTLFAALVAVVFAGHAFAQNGSFQVIVNSKNPAANMAKKDVKNLFLKRTTEWTNGTRATIVDLPEESPVREEFSETVLGRSMEAMTGHWQKMVFSGRASPPRELKTDADVIAFVSANASAIGYVSSEAQIAEGVRVLNLTD